jgi:ketosteroid isomerase-like protein
VLVQSPAPLPPALEQMVATERAFAAMGAEKGARDSFLAYFADEAMMLEGAEPRPARDAIRAWPAPQPGTQLLWEPRTGDIASSGDLGYLTGPVTRVAADGARRHACYMSVWKKQADGRFKVVMDFGVTTPQPAPFAPGFVRSWDQPRYKGGPSADAGAALEAEERALATAARTSLEAAFVERLTDTSRVYRNGAMPLVGKVAIMSWLANQQPVAWTVEHVEVAARGDFGYAWGSTTAAPVSGRSQAGYFVRVWGRGADGRWRVLVDVAE